MVYSDCFVESVPSMLTPDILLQHFECVVNFGHCYPAALWFGETGGISDFGIICRGILVVSLLLSEF